MNNKRQNWADALSIVVLVILAASIASCQPKTTPDIVALPPKVTYAEFSSLPRVLGIVVDQDSVVVYVEPDSAAARAGVIAGDSLAAIGDTQLTPQTLRSSDAKSQLKIYIHVASEPDSGKTDAKPIEITVLRKGSSDKLRLVPSPPSFGSGSRDMSKPSPTVTPVLDPLYYF